MKPTKCIEMILEGKEVERPLVSLWKHFPIIDRKPQLFIKRIVEFQNKYNWDFIKLCYNGLYSIEDWGSVIKWPMTEDEVGVVTEYSIKDEIHWKELKPLPVSQGALAREIAITKEVVNIYKGEVPVIGTVFSPLTTAIKMTGDEIFKHIDYYPESLHRGLEVITETTINFVKELLKLQVDGIFFATQLGTYDRLSVEKYMEFGTRYDIPILEAVKGKTWFNILHIHGEDPMFDELKSYPVEAINWHDRKVKINLKEARKKTNKVLIGGIDEYGVLNTGDEEELREHIKDALLQVGDNRIILGPGCVVPLYVPEENFNRLNNVIDSLKR